MNVRELIEKLRECTDDLEDEVVIHYKDSDGTFEIDFIKNVLAPKCGTVEIICEGLTNEEVALIDF
jgi:hypothetical protein